MELSIYIYALMIAVLCFTLAIISKSHYINDVKKFCYKVSCIANIVILMGLIISICAVEYKIDFLDKSANSLVYVFSAIVPMFLCLSAMKRIVKRVTFGLSIVPFLVICLIIASVFLGWLETSEMLNPLYITVSIITSAYFVLWCILSLVLHPDRNRKEKIFYFGIMVFVVASIIVQLVVSSIEAIWLASPVIIVLTYIFNAEISSEYDVMTEVRNRTAYSSDIEEIDNKSIYTVIMIDINRLKYVNDTFGHKKGDELIIGVANTISKAFHKLGKTYRIGGDEFVVICDYIDDDLLKSTCKSIVEKLRNFNLNIDYIPSVSWGLCSHDDDEKETFAETAKIADENMYEMKQWFHKMLDEKKDPYAKEVEWEFRWFVKDKNEFGDKK